MKSAQDVKPDSVTGGLMEFQFKVEEEKLYVNIRFFVGSPKHCL